MVNMAKSFIQVAQHFCHVNRILKFAYSGSSSVQLRNTVKGSTLQSYLKRKSNIVLMGSPGCGKTTVGRLVADRLGMSFVDIDDDYLEKIWGTTISKKLHNVGGTKFLEEEGSALLKLEVFDTVVSLTGSNPMHSQSMTHVMNTGIVFFLDVQISDILDRLQKMKVSRIVGQEDGISTASILKYRQQFYEKSYDVRIICKENATIEEICDKIIHRFKELFVDKGFTSTREDKTQLKIRRTFSNVILQGLAEDGGLFVSTMPFPTLSIMEWQRLVYLDYADRALRILEQWFHPHDMHSTKLREFVDIAYNKASFHCQDIFPVKHLIKNQYLIELFHGPTASFKDAALQLLPMFFQEALRVMEDKKVAKYVILVATSGDTGSAVLDGFARNGGELGVGVMVLFPEEGISDIQKKQMTSVQGKNIHVVGVRGDFDFCQSVVKKAFNDPRLLSYLAKTHGCKLSAANSINWGRLLPQVVYHASAYLDLIKKGIISLGEEVDICIPTGNFGNILAAYYAKEMGIPLRRLICASNCNNVLTEFINTGHYDLTSRELKQTTSPAIDILGSSNLERFLYHTTSGTSSVVKDCFHSLKKKKSFTVSPRVLEQIQSIVVADWCSEEKCQQTIKDTYSKTGYLLDPHTAVGKAIADRFNNEDRPMLIAATAHYAKFAENVVEAIGQDTDKKAGHELLKMLSNLQCQPTPHETLIIASLKPRLQRTTCDADYSNIVEEIERFAESM